MATASAPSLACSNIGPAGGDVRVQVCACVCKRRGVFRVRSLQVEWSNDCFLFWFGFCGGGGGTG